MPWTRGGSVKEPRLFGSCRLIGKSKTKQHPLVGLSLEDFEVLKSVPSKNTPLEGAGTSTGDFVWITTAVVSTMFCLGVM